MNNARKKISISLISCMLFACIISIAGCGGSSGSHLSNSVTADYNYYGSGNYDRSTEKRMTLELPSDAKTTNDAASAISEEVYRLSGFVDSFDTSYNYDESVHTASIQAHVPVEKAEEFDAFLKGSYSVVDFVESTQLTTDKYIEEYDYEDDYDYDKDKDAYAYNVNYVSYDIRVNTTFDRTVSYKLWSYTKDVLEFVVNVLKILIPTAIVIAICCIVFYVFFGIVVPKTMIKARQIGYKNMLANYKGKPEELYKYLVLTSKNIQVSTDDLKDIMVEESAQ